MKILLILTLVLGLVGCEKEEEIIYAPLCETASDKAALAQFILDCSKNANNMADEEMEDVIYQCQKSGELAICPLVPCHEVYVSQGRSYYIRAALRP